VTSGFPRITKRPRSWRYGSINCRRLLSARRTSADPCQHFWPDAQARLLERLAEAGVHRIVPYIPSADHDTILAALDEFAKLRDALLG
jgi:hypothetical protein